MCNSFVNDLIKLFFNSDFKVVISSFDSFKVSAKLKADEVFYPSVDDLSGFLKLVEGKNLQFSFGGFGNSVRFSTNKNDYSKKLSELKQEIQALDYNDPVEFELEVLDFRSDSSVDIFDKNTFFLYLSTLNAQTLLEEFSKFSFDKKIEFRFWEDISSFNTDSIYFISTYPNNGNHLDSPSINKQKRERFIADRAKVSHFVNAKNNCLIPDDFKVVSGHAHNGITDILNGIFGVLCLTFISDFSSIHDNHLDVQIKGYKKVLDTLSFSEMKIANHDEFYNIYSWVYSEGSFVDKIGVARNVISIHLVDGRLLNIGGGVLDSVLSGYDLYLKENVKQYIEIKNKINDFLYSQSDKSQALVESVFSTIKTSIWGFSTFFISVFLLRVVSGKTFGGVVTGEILSVSILLVFISWLYVLFTFDVLKKDKVRLLSKYQEVRDRYLDLMNENDLDRIMKTEEIKAKEEAYIDERAKSYRRLWFLVCISFVVVNISMYLYGKYYVPQSKTQVDIPEVKDDATKSVINFICIAPKLDAVKSCQIEREEHTIPSAPLREEVEEDFLRS